MEAAGPSVVAIDSPCSTAPPGHTRREGERLLRDAVCRIRWTPPADQLHANPYYEWIVEGLALYRELETLPTTVIECFPSASWTRRHGPRNGRRRSRWTREALAALELDGIPPAPTRISVTRSLRR